AAVRLHVVRLTESEAHAGDSGPQLAPTPTLEPVDELEAEHFPIPGDRRVEAPDAQGGGQPPVVLERWVSELCGSGRLCAHGHPPVDNVLPRFYTSTTFVSSDALPNLLHNRWSVPVLAELARGDAGGGRFANLRRRLGVSGESRRRTLATLVEAGLVARNPGHGHPLRADYVLTP